MTSLSFEPGDAAQVADLFSAAHLLEVDHRLFAPPKPKDVVRLAQKASRFTKANGWLDPAAARERIEGWKARARLQSKERANSEKIVLSLFDHTGNWSRPWEEAGYQVIRFDIQDNPEIGDVNAFGAGFFGEWFSDFDGLDVYAILAACPCTEFAVSGARHFAAKDADGRTSAAVELVHQTLRTIEYYRPAIWAIENPVGRIERMSGLPPWRLAFDPCHLGDPYTKRTQIWGRFNANLPVAPVEPKEGSKMHLRFGGKSMATKNARSETPEGFSYGFFLANNALDNPALAIAGKFDRLDSALIHSAIATGVSVEEIEEIVSDLYYMDMDDTAANTALAEARAAMQRQASVLR